MSQENEVMGLFERTIPVSKAVVAIFAKEQRIHFAKDDSGALYISNGHFALKTTQTFFDKLIAQINNRRKMSVVEPFENARLLEIVKNAKGNFELTQPPHELKIGNSHTSYVYADNKQYFQYDKKYVDIFSNSQTRLFVDDSTDYGFSSHNLIVKNRKNDVLGVALPITVPDELYTKLADILPLEIPWKSEIERIKENPQNDPYIGKEFFDGRDTFIVSAIRNHNGVDMYVVPTIENGRLSRHADLIEVGEIEKHIALWASNRISRETQRREFEKQTAPPQAVKKPGINEQMADGAKKAAEHNAARAADPAKDKKTKNTEIS